MLNCRPPEEAEVERGVAAAVEGGAVRVEDVPPHLGHARRVVADYVAQVPRLNAYFLNVYSRYWTL